MLRRGQKIKILTKWQFKSGIKVYNILKLFYTFKLTQAFPPRLLHSGVTSSHHNGCLCTCSNLKFRPTYCNIFSYLLVDVICIFGV